MKKSGFSFIEIAFTMCIVMVLLGMQASLMTTKQEPQKVASYGEYVCYVTYDNANNAKYHEKYRYNTDIFTTKEVGSCSFKEPSGTVNSYNIKLVGGGAAGSMPTDFKIKRKNITTDKISEISGIPSGKTGLDITGNVYKDNYDITGYRTYEQPIIVEYTAGTGGGAGKMIEFSAVPSTAIGFNSGAWNGFAIGTPSDAAGYNSTVTFKGDSMSDFASCTVSGGNTICTAEGGRQLKGEIATAEFTGSVASPRGEDGQKAPAQTTVATGAEGGNVEKLNGQSYSGNVVGTNGGGTAIGAGGGSATFYLDNVTSFSGVNRTSQTIYQMKTDAGYLAEKKYCGSTWCSDNDLLISGEEVKIPDKDVTIGTGGQGAGGGIIITW